MFILFGWLRMSKRNVKQWISIKFYVKICKSTSEMLFKMAYGDHTVKNFSISGGSSKSK